MTTDKATYFDLFAVDGNGKRASWTRIGVLFPYKDGTGFNIELTALPLGSHLVALPPKPKAENVPMP